MAKTTLQHVATSARCSVGVVSSVLNRSKGNMRVSEQLRQRIIETAAELNYRPNFAARSLVKQSTRTIGIYVAPHPFSSIAQAYEGGILRGIEKACREHRFSLLILNLAGNEPPEFCLEQIQEQRIDGLIVFKGTLQSDWIDKFTRQSGVMVIVGSDPSGQAAYSFDFDNAACMDLAVSHLAQLGHTRIGFLGSCLAMPSVHALERAAGFEASMRQRGLPVLREYIFDRAICSEPIQPEHNYCVREGYCGAEYMLSLPREIRPTALIAYNDQAASGAYSRLYELSRRIPEEFSIVGIDNQLFCDVLTPRLTSIGQPLNDMGYQAALELIHRLEEPDACGTPKTGSRRLFSPELVIRQSTARLRS